MAGKNKKNIIILTNYQEGDTMELTKETRDRIYAAADALAAA
ncbi:MULTISPECIES: hypothetical protein [Sphingomonadaceae]